MPLSDQGVTNDRSMLTPRTLTFLTRGDSILLIKGAPHKTIWANRYNGIGGHVERGEDILSSAKRELFEETGISPDTLWLCGTVTIDINDRTGIGLYLFLGEANQEELIESNEGSLEWVSLSRVGSLPLVEDLPTLLPRLLKWQPGDMPISAHYRYDNNSVLEIHFGGDVSVEE